MNRIIATVLLITAGGVAPGVALGGNDIRFENPRVAIVRESGHLEGRWDHRPLRANSLSVNAFCQDQGYNRGGYLTRSFYENGAVAAFSYGEGWHENNGEEAVRALKCRNNR